MEERCEKKEKKKKKALSTTTPPSPLEVYWDCSAHKVLPSSLITGRCSLTTCSPSPSKATRTKRIHHLRGRHRTFDKETFQANAKPRPQNAVEGVRRFPQGGGGLCQTDRIWRHPHLNRHRHSLHPCRG